jgi:hypothetical protein
MNPHADIQIRWKLPGKRWNELNREIPNESMDWLEVQERDKTLSFIPTGHTTNEHDLLVPFVQATTARSSDIIHVSSWRCVRTLVTISAKSYFRSREICSISTLNIQGEGRGLMWNIAGQIRWFEISMRDGLWRAAGDWE